MTGPDIDRLVETALEQPHTFEQNERRIQAVRDLAALARERDTGLWSGSDPRVVTLRRERDEALNDRDRLARRVVELEAGQAHHRGEQQRAADRLRDALGRVAELEAALRVMMALPAEARREMKRVGREALAGDGGGACDGSSDCEATVHLHGCYSDDGTNCDHPSEHTAGDGGDDAAIVKTIRERDAADTGERITLGDLVADIEAAREEAAGDGGGA